MVSLEATFTLIDEASAKLDSIALKARAADKALRGMGGTTGGMEMAKEPTAAAKALDIMRKSSEDAAQSTKKLAGETDTASAALTKHRGVLGTVASAFGTLGRGISSVFGWFKQLPGSIDASTKSFVANHSAIKNVSGSVAGLAVGLKNLIAPFGLMSAGILAATSAATPLIGTLGELLGSLTSMVGGGAAIGAGVLGSFVAGLGSVVAVAKPAITQLTNYTTAVKNLQTAEESGSASSVKAAQQRLDAIAKANPGVAQLSQNLTGLEDAWKKATAPGRTQFFDLANTALGDMRKNLSYLGPQADADTKAVNQAFQRNLSPFLSGKTFQDLATRLSEIFQKNIGPFAHGITNIFKGLDNILRDLQPQMEGVGNWFDKLSKRFEDWTTHTKTIKQMGTDFHDWGRILGDVAKILASVLGAGSKQGSSMVGKWADSMDKLTTMLTGSKGQKGIQSFFSQATSQMNKLWPTLKDVATTLLHIYQAWKPLGGVYLKLLDSVAKVTADIPTPLLTGALAVIISGKAAIGAGGAFSKVAGGISKWAGPGAGKGAAAGAEEVAEKGVGKRLLGKAATALSQQGETPLKPLYVEIVNEGFGTGAGGGGLGGKAKREVGAAEEVAEGVEGEAKRPGLLGRITERIKGSGVGKGVAGLVERGGAAKLAVGAGAAGLAERGRGLLSTLSRRTGIGRAGGAAEGEETMSLLGRLTKGSGWHGLGGATGGLTGMLATAALPLAGGLIPKGLRESGVGKWAGTTLGGFLGSGVLGAGVQGINALLPASLRRAGATKAAVNVGMQASLGGSLAPLIGVGMAPGALATGGLAAGSLLRNKVGGLGGRLASIGVETAAGAAAGSAIPLVGTAAGAAIGGAVGTFQAYNPFSAKGRSNISKDAKTVWDGIKTGATQTAKFVARQAVYYNPFSASGQRHIARAAVQTWNTVKGGVTDAGKWVGRQATKFNPFSASGRKNIIHGADQAWQGIKSGASATGKWLAGTGKTISHPFTQAFGWVKNAGHNTFNWMKGAASDVVKHVGDFFTKTPLGKLIMTPFKDAFTFVKGLPGKIGGVIKSIPGHIAQFAKSILNSFLSPFKSAFSFITGLPGKIGNVAKNIGGKVVSGVKTGAKAVAGVASGGFHAATHAVGSAASAVGSFLGFAHGGRVPHSASVLVGEAGPELVHLPAGAHVQPLTGPYAWPEFGMQTGIAQPLATPGPVRAGLNIVGQIFSGELNAQGIARLANGVRALSNALTGRDSLESALDDVGDQFDDTSKRARNDWQDMISATKDATDKIGKDLTDANDALTKNYNQLVKSIKTAMDSGVLATQAGVDKVFSLMAKAFSTLGVSSPVAKRVQKASGGAKKTARGGRLPGPAIGDHIPLFDKGGNLLGIADGGELVVNRHTESRVNAKLAAFGTTLGREVAGERTPHAKYERGGRVPRFATGGVVGQVDQFFSAHGFDKIAIAGILGNAMQESGLNPNTPGGGMWQQISNFGQGTGGSLLAQMQRMLPQIEGLRNALNRASSPGQAAQIFEQGFEKAGIPAMANRIRYAQQAYAGKLGGALSGAAGGSVATVAKIKAPKVSAPGLLPGEIATLAQQGVTAVTTAVNKVLQSAAGTAMGGGGGAGAAPMAGPAAVKAMIRKADEIASHNYYYEWGGGHNGGFAPSHGTGHGSGPGVGYDCSGSVSAVLHAAGLLNAPQTAGFFESFGSPGPGKHVTIWAAPWHTFMRINGHYFGTSGQNFGGGANWMPHFPENLVTVRHPTGLARGGRISRRGDSPVAHPKTSKLTEQQFADMTAVEQQRHRRNQGAIMRGMALGGRIPWFADGADFIAKRPQLIGVGDAPGGERVTVTPQRQNPTTTRPVHVEIHNIQVNRKGDVQKIVDEEMRLLAASLGGS